MMERGNMMIQGEIPVAGYVCAGYPLATKPGGGAPCCPGCAVYGGGGSIIDG